MSGKNSKNSALRSECIAALSGAEYVRERVLSLLNVGPQNIASNFYAIKCRVKSEDSLIEKVQRKRLREKRADYRAEDVTDLVGLRILTILSRDLVDAAFDFLDFISFCQRPEIKLVQGHKLEDGIEEIIVYQSKNNSKAYELVYSSLLRLLPGARSDGKPKVQLLPADDDRPYSSIHIISKCISHYAKSPKFIPLETQIRTIFEDAWNELDHPIRYKGMAGAGARFNLQQGRMVDSTKAQLVTLKNSLENCGRQADQISDTAPDLVSSFRQKHKQKAAATVSFPIALDFKIGESAVFSARRRELIEIEKECDRLFAESYLAAARKFEESTGRCEALLARIKAIRDDSTREFGNVCNDDLDFKYFTRMQEALLHVWLGRLEKHLNERVSVKAGAKFDQALNCYFELEADPRFRSDSYLRLRLSNCFLAAGFDGAALEKIREAAQACENDQRLKKGSVVQYRVLMQLGYLCWNKRQRLREEGERIGILDFRFIDQVELLGEAIVATTGAVRWMRRSRLKGDERTDEESRLFGNLASYVWEIGTLTSDEEAKSLLDKSCAPAQIVRSLRRWCLSHPDDWMAIDSAMKACLMLGDRKSGLRWLDSLRAFVKTRDAQKKISWEQLQLLERSIQEALSYVDQIRERR